MNPLNGHIDLAHRLIVRAAHRAPAALAERLAEEWLADLGARTGSLSRLRLAVGCSWASAIILRDLRVPRLAGAATGHKTAVSDVRYDLPLLSRRTVVLIVIVAVHALLIYGFMSGFAQHVATSIPNLMNGVIIEEARPQPLPRVTPAVPPSLIHETLTGIVDPGNFNFPSDDDVPQGPAQGPTSTPDAPAVPVVRVLGGPGKGFPATDDYYPSLSRRMAETGVANVQVCVDGRGNLTGDPTLVKSSGLQRIDAAAVNLARAGSGHYRPTTENGTPVNSCYAFRIRFELQD